VIENGQRLDRPQARSDGERGRGGRRDEEQRDSAEAWAEVDVRIARKADGPRIERKFAALKPADKRCKLAVTGGINRPPMERTRGTVRSTAGQGAGRGAGLPAGRSR
jgi:ribosomal protein S6E (S10)